MGLFPQSFIEDLRMQADIVQVIQDVTPLKKAGAAYKGLCPFHAEKTPSFSVNREKGFFKCFGCGVSGDVFKFLEMHERLPFPEAVRQLAQRFGLVVPEAEDATRERVLEGEREALLKMHEIAAAHFREQLSHPGGARARQMLEQRGVSPEMIERLSLGYAPAARNALLARLVAQGFDKSLIARSGLVSEREGGETVDRFRNRLMIPICRDSGAIVAFGGRAMEADQQPKYLNSPETAIYTKGRTLYGLNLTKEAIKQAGYAVLVEGYFDFAQLVQAGIKPVVASCGTALTSAQAQTLRRFAGKTVISFDPDAAGQTAAARSCELLVTEGFQVNVVILPAGLDPDSFVQEHGGNAYAERLKTSRPYLEYLLDRAAAAHDLATDEGRHAYLTAMLGVAARVPDAAARDQFADRLAHRAHILEEVVRDEIRKAAVARRTNLTRRELPSFGEVKQAEKGLLWSLLRRPEAAMSAMAELTDEDVAPLRTGAILQTALMLREWPAEALPSTLLERLTPREADLVQKIASEPSMPAPADDCAREIKRLRYERERAAVQREIERLQEAGAAGGSDVESLSMKKLDLSHRIEALST